MAYPTVVPWARPPPAGDGGERQPALAPPALPAGRGQHAMACKRVGSQADMDRWKRSGAFEDIVGFIRLLNDRVSSKPLSGERVVSPAVRAIGSKLAEMKQWINEIPAIQQPMRFGNKAFRMWHARMAKDLPDFFKSLLPAELVDSGAALEISPYWLESFGNLQRIDYGTGHELNFVAWLCCLFKLRVLGEPDSVAIVFDAFLPYIDLMRQLQRVYWLEPAGSKGVWGLDDYQFLPFLWGSAQLFDHASLTPAAVTNDDLLAAHAAEFMYFQSVRFVREMKTGLFAETSPLLSDIAALPRWQKVLVNSGLLNMYHGEVLGKFPVVQHFFFGTLLSFGPPAHAAPQGPPQPAQPPQTREERPAAPPAAVEGPHHGPPAQGV